jgi:Flp pilus assembly protein TadG
MLEFLLVIVLFMTTLMGVFEICRLLLAFSTLANASRVGVRYATTHGSENEVGFPATATQIETIVRDFTKGTLIGRSDVAVTTTWPSGSDPGDEVRVRVQYPYQPFILLPMSTTLGSQTEGIITF